MEIIITQTEAVCGYMAAVSKVRVCRLGCGLGWKLVLVCDAQRRCSLVRWIVALSANFNFTLPLQRCFQSLSFKFLGSVFIHQQAYDRRLKQDSLCLILRISTSVVITQILFTRKKREKWSKIVIFNETIMQQKPKIETLYQNENMLHEWFWRRWLLSSLLSFIAPF